MMGFVERSLEVLFQTQTSKNRTLQKEEIHVNVSPGERGGGGGWSYFLSYQEGSELTCLTWQGALHYST